MKVSHKSKAHRTQLSLKNSVSFWKLHSRFFEFINTFYAYDSTCIQMFTFLNYFNRTHAFTYSIQMHSCIQTSSIQIDSQRTQTFTAPSWTLQCHQDMSEKCLRLRIYVHIFMATIKQIPKDDSLTASTNVVLMQYPNTLPNTKMTLRQLVRPIEVVSPEHSSDDRSHKFQIASQMNACIEFSKAEYARPTKALAHYTTSARLSKQSQKLSSLTSHKYWISTRPVFARSFIGSAERCEASS